MEDLRWKPKTWDVKPVRVVSIETDHCFPHVSPAQIILEAHLGMMRTFFQAIEIMFGLRK